METIKESLIKFFACIFLCLVLTVSTLGCMVYYVYRGIDLACIAIYSYWRAGNYLKSIATLVAASLITTIIWFEIYELALKISWWLFDSIESQFGLLIIFLFCFATIAVSKAIKNKDDENMEGEE